MSTTQPNGQHHREAKQQGLATHGAHRQATASDLRERMPETGLREYWYPAMAARKVGKRKPVALRILGGELVLFRDKRGEVVALQKCLSTSRHASGHGRLSFRRDGELSVSWLDLRPRWRMCRGAW